MKNGIRFLVGINLILLIILFLLLDPFVFFPKTYEESPIFLGIDLKTVKTISLSESRFGNLTELSFSNEDGVWFMKNAEKSQKYMVDAGKVNEIFQNLGKIHRFEKSKKLISDEEFIGERMLMVEFSPQEGPSFSMEFGKCYQPKSECLVREKNSRQTYTIPHSIHEILPSLSLEVFLTKHPFGGIRTSEISKLSFHINGSVKYSVYKEKGNWKTFPEIEGKLNEKFIEDLLLRLVSWSGEKGVLLSAEKNEKLSQVTSQSLNVEFQDFSGATKEVSVEEVDFRFDNNKLNRINPYEQFIVMTPYSWEYWRYYDIKQLSATTD
jgi:hypothetical protein